MKRFLPTILIMLVLIAVPTAVFAHTQALSTTTFYACEATSTSGGIHIGDVDTNSITQDDALSCDPNGAYPLKVQWSVTGPAGKDGANGTNGKDGIPFSHAACAETGLTGSAEQENMVFCQSGIEPDGGLVYKAAIAAAQVHIMVGTPISTEPSTDWGKVAITYVEFTSSFHAEYRSDNLVRFYNTLNQRVS